MPAHSTITSPATYRYYSLQAAIAQAYATCRRHLLSVLFASILGLGHAPYPGDTEISVPWLTKTLKASGTIPADATITSIECTGLDGNRGLVGVMTRVHIVYVQAESTSKNSAQDSHHLHLILKKSKDGRLPRLGNIISGQAREAIFYSSNLAKELMPKTLLSQVHYAQGSTLLGEYVILMDDIKQRRDKGDNAGDDASRLPIDVNFVFGNQIWGVPPTIDRSTLPSTDKMLEQLFITAAEIHAQHWNDSRLMQLGWLKTAAWYQGRNRTRWEWSVFAGANAWALGKANAASGEYPVKYSDKFIKIMDDAFSRASWERLQARLQDRTIPFTLSHGDYHAANMILDRSRSSTTPDLVIYDWSEVCIWEPTTDLGQTVISDVAIPVFQAQARTALQKYWERLVELGAVNPSEYSLETCWKSFLRSGVEKWLWVFAILCSYPGMPAPGIQYFHDQMLAFIELGEKEGGIAYDITTVICFAPKTSSQL
ncbi:hypothetical protein BGZ99_006922 [Dissophora globulifera]|uniref:Aminoglycoside phosphotransferase domain-containing protein n=1 Tax=Dissophora globulifera TaxID=979702 RepID=A0A9P6RC87_9FUNG|nr:hypothetical protein BGZ99_006922 [Dissophora globulifera]